MTGASSSRVHIVDDDELVRAKLSYLLSNCGYSVAVYSDGPELFRASDLTRGCILLDICMPSMSGHEVQEELARLGSMLPVIAMSAWGDIPAVVRAMKLGAVNFLEKPMGAEVLIEAVAGAWASLARRDARRRVTVAATARLSRVSPRQRQILQGLLDGLSNKEMAKRLNLRPRTIEMHRARLRAELGLKSMSEAVRFAIDAELVPIGRADRREAEPCRQIGAAQ
jgi:two-component system response regulator FixJ